MNETCLVLLITFVLLVWISNGQNFLYYYLSSGTSCSGSGTITSDGLNEEVTFDASGIYKADGWTKTRTMDDITRYYRFTLCGDLANTTCNGDWCFEEVNASNHNDCYEALARWEENDDTTITYGVYYNETIDSSTNETKPDKPVALHVQIADHKQINKDCPNNESWINYNIYCKNGDTSTTFLALWSNYSECIWNVSYYSSYGCVTTTAIDSSTSAPETTPAPTKIIINTGSNNSNDKLSSGSILVIIFVVVILTYLILGCAYNSFYHGRVGVDAIPNKGCWTQFWRYFKAGCETTYDTLCCHQGNVDYQNL